MSHDFQLVDLSPASAVPTPRVVAAPPLRFARFEAQRAEALVELLFPDHSRMSARFCMKYGHFWWFLMVFEYKALHDSKDETQHLKQHLCVALITKSPRWRPKLQPLVACQFGLPTGRRLPCLPHNVCQSCHMRSFTEKESCNHHI